MAANRPRHIRLGETAVPVSSWQETDDRAQLTAVLKGDQIAQAILAVADSRPITLQWGDHPAWTGHAEIRKHAHSGSGPTAVHRLTIEVWPLPDPAAETELSLEDEVRLLRQEVARLRADVAALQRMRGDRARFPETLRPGAAGTLIEQDIPIEPDTE